MHGHGGVPLSIEISVIACVVFVLGSIYFNIHAGKYNNVEIK